jgi:hypothetical protein
VTTYETHKDDSPQATGVHKGSGGAAVLYSKDANFNKYIVLGVQCYNTTQGTNGVITALTTHTVTATGVTWDLDDEYEIYLTDTKNSFISKIAVGRIYGHKLEYGEEEEYDDTE